MVQRDLSSLEVVLYLVEVPSFLGLCSSLELYVLASFLNDSGSTAGLWMESSRGILQENWPTGFVAKFLLRLVS